MKYIYFILLLITITGCKNWNGDKTINKLKKNRLFSYIRTI